MNCKKAKLLSALLLSTFYSGKSVCFWSEDFRTCCEEKANNDD